MTTHAVLIVGGGPTGLMLAGELALAGVDVGIVERRVDRTVVGSRAGGLHARTIEVLDQRGIADRFLVEGQTHPSVSFHVPLSLADCPTRHPYVLALGQKRIERLLGERVDALRVPVHRGQDVTGVAQDDDGVDVALSDGRSLRAAWLVGCDGGRSLVRKATGIAFPGWDATTSWLIGEFETSEDLPWGLREDTTGIHAIARGDAPGTARFVLTERALSHESEPTMRDFVEALVAVYGSDFGITPPAWISRFTDVARQAAAYRERRVLLAGDAAHVHAPIGGQGLNIGVQDAVNLGWKLARVVHGVASPDLLDSYHAERHPVAARVLRNTMALVALRRTDDHAKALAERMAALLAMDEPRRRLAAEMSGLDVHYDAGDDTARHALVGRRMPDLDLVTADGALRVYALLHDAQPLLLRLDGSRTIDVGPWADRVRVVEARPVGTWALPAIGPVAAPNAVLVRPDGYVAWTDADDAPLADALATWFGPRIDPASSSRRAGR